MLDMLHLYRRRCACSNLLSLVPPSAIWSDMSNVSLLMPNRRILQERPRHGNPDIVAKVRVSKFPFKQRGEDGNQPDAHCHSFSIPCSCWIFTK